MQQRPSPDDTATEITERALTRAAKAAIVSHCSGAPSGATAVVGIAAGATTLPTRITDALRSYVDSFTEQDENNASCNTRLNKIVCQPNSLYTILYGIEPIKALAALSVLRQTSDYDIWANQQLSLDMTAADSSVGTAFFDYMADEFSLLPQNRTLAISVLPGSTKRLANIFVDKLYGTAEINEKLALGCHINLFQYDLTNYIKGVIDETASAQVLDEAAKVQTFFDEYEFETAVSSPEWTLLEKTLPNEEISPTAQWGISPSKPTEPSEEKKTPSGVKNPLQPHDWLKEGGALKTIFPSTDGQSPKDAQVKKSRERIAEFCKAMEDLNIVCQEQTLKGKYVDHKNRTIIEAYKTVTEATNRMLRVLYTVNPGSFSQNAPELVDLMMETLPNTLRPLFYNVMQYAKRTQPVLTEMQPEEPEVKTKLLRFLDNEISVTERLSLVAEERKNDLVTVLMNLKEVLSTPDDGMIMPCCLLAKIACDRELNRVTDFFAQAAERSLSFFGAKVKIVAPKSSERFMNDIGCDYCPWIEDVTQKNTELFQNIHRSLFHSSSKLNPGHVIDMYKIDIENYLTMVQSQDLVISSGQKK